MTAHQTVAEIRGHSLRASSDNILPLTLFVDIYVDMTVLGDLEVVQVNYNVPVT